MRTDFVEQPHDSLSAGKDDLSCGDCSGCEEVSRLTLEGVQGVKAEELSKDIQCWLVNF